MDDSETDEWGGIAAGSEALGDEPFRAVCSPNRPKALNPTDNRLPGYEVGRSPNANHQTTPATTFSHDRLPEGEGVFRSSLKPSALVSDAEISLLEWKTPVLNRPNVLLTLAILQKIRDSNIHSAFNPSKSLGDLVACQNRGSDWGIGKPAAVHRVVPKATSLAHLSNLARAWEEEDKEEGWGQQHKREEQENQEERYGGKTDTSQNANANLPPCAEIDVVISGGGMKGYFATGCVDVLKHALHQHNIRIARVAGASAGAWAAFFAILDISTSFWMETYFATKESPGKTIHEVYLAHLWPWLVAVIPEDAYLRCKDKLHISITQVTWFGLKNRIICEWDSNQDLFECLLASSTIPFLTERTWWGRRYRGMYVLDGGFTNNTPCFSDGTHRQLVIHLSGVEYPHRLLLSANDTCIDALVLRGALMMDRFLRGDNADNNNVIVWLGKKKKKDADMTWVRTPNYFLRSFVIAPLFVATVCVYRGAVLSLFPSYAFLSTENAQQLLAQIPFADAAAEFGTKTLPYCASVLFANVVDCLQRMNLLI